MSVDAVGAQSAHVFMPMGHPAHFALDPQAIGHFAHRCAALGQTRWADLTLSDVARFREALAGVAAGSLRPYTRGLLNQAIARADKLEYQLAVSPLGMATRPLAEAAMELCETLASLKAEREGDLSAADRRV